MTKEIRKFYFGDHAIDAEAIERVVDLESDFNFAWGIARSAKHLTQHSTGKTFYFMFSVDSKLNVFKNLNLLNRDELYNQADVAAHGDDLCYLFR